MGRLVIFLVSRGASPRWVWHILLILWPFIQSH